MPKKRTKENNGLPKRWRIRSGSYYYRVPENLKDKWDGKTEYLLGRTEVEAYRTWAEKSEAFSEAIHIDSLVDRYMIEVSPFKAKRSQQAEKPVSVNLRKSLGHIPIRELKPSMVYQLKDKIGKRSESLANSHISLLSHMFTKAIEWGYCDTHPIKNNVNKFSYTPRDRYVTDDELAEFLKVASPLMQVYIPLKLATSLRKIDLLSLKLADLKDDGIHVTQRKTKKKIIVAWSDELRVIIENIKQLPRKVGSMYLFYNRVGQCYVNEDDTTSGFDSAWQRDMKKALKKTELELRFTEHDIRAKSASDTTLEHAQELLSHSDSSFTDRVYMRKTKIVQPHDFKAK